MALFRQYLAPLLVVLVFLVSLLTVSARIFLPGDMAAPAPIDTPMETAITPGADQAQVPDDEAVAHLPPALSTLMTGLPDDPTQL